MAYRAARMAKLQADSGIKLLKFIPEGPERHTKDVVALTYSHDMLISGADDGKIKVTPFYT